MEFLNNLDPNQEIGPMIFDQLTNLLGQEFISRYVPYGAQSTVRTVLQIFKNLNNRNESSQSASAPPKEVLPIPQRPLVPTLPQMVPQEDSSTPSFPGFAQKSHVLYIGATNSGKTSLFITHLAKELYKFGRLIVNTGRADTENIENFRKAALYNIQVVDEESPENKFGFFPPDQTSNIIDESLKGKQKHENTLALFDDIQASSADRLKKIAQFILEAKNANTQCVTMLHMAYNNTEEKAIREAARYLVLCNQPMKQFNQILNLKGENETWRKYNGIPDAMDRKIIIDKEDASRPKIYYATGKMLLFNTLLEKNEQFN